MAGTRARGASIARASGVDLVEQDGALLVVELGTSWAYTTAFVVGLVAFLFGAFGLVQLVLAMSGAGGLIVLGAVFVVIGAIGAGALGLIMRWVRARNAAAIDPSRIVVVIDPDAGQLRAPDGTVLAPLTSVTLRHAFQVTSSSRALHVCWPGGSALVARGNPFAGGLGPIERALLARRVRFS